MSFFQIDSKNLRNEGSRLEELIQKFRGEKENLTANEQTLKSMWEGEANENFHQAFMRDLGQMEAFIDLLVNYVRVMETIADRYDNAEARNMGIASNRIY